VPLLRLAICIAGITSSIIAFILTDPHRLI
jgi:hypothetical protein